MKILAVIPARAGSKGIPNKNIRLVAGRPLVAYAIANALASRHITDVVVTTDSDMVRVVAEQMGARTIARSAELCGDAVTLDAVVHDAASRFDCDVVVTMQPTSPTLKAETLDKAIDRFLDDGLDTLISAVNRPHLAWTRGADGGVVPAYERRLNRQYLPPHYAETGRLRGPRAGVDRHRHVRGPRRRRDDAGGPQGRVLREREQQARPGARLPRP